jgi:hypothetical protein
VFHGLDFIVSFVGMGGTRARLLGVYRVLGHRSSLEVALPPGCPYLEWQQSGFFYDLMREPAFDEFTHRIVIDWGRGTLAWHQNASNKPVTEILPQGQLLQPFRDYLEFSLSFSELRYLYAHEEANKEWRARLGAVAGIYLILAVTTGAQYVGSACGTEGIWGRWSTYAHDGHGGNVLLQQLLAADSAYPAGLSYSILQILPRTLALSEVLEWERRYKVKLGSRAIGLNGN